MAMEALCKASHCSGLLSRAVETVYPVIGARGPRFTATGISQCLRHHPLQWSHVNQTHSSCVALPGQSFQCTSSWRTGCISLLGAYPLLGHQNRDFMTPQLMTTSHDITTAATHRTFPAIHPFLLRVPHTACNLRHHYHSVAAITFTRQYTSDPKLSTPPPHQSGYYSHWRPANRSTLTYMVAIAVAVVGLAYAAVPLYRLFCQASGYGGTVIRADPSEKVENMQPIRERKLTIRFNADTSAGMRWQFKPDQKEIKLVPGETALAFYTARNPTDEAVTGIAMYNVIPFEAGQYFNKIQCFCFEEQRLNPREQVDMPVFFYIDPEFNEDPAMARVDTITLSYTFFQAKEGESLNLPLPRQTL